MTVLHAKQWRFEMMHALIFFLIALHYNSIIIFLKYTKKTITFILIIHYLHELNDPKCAQLITGLLNSCQKFHALKIVPRSLLAKIQKKYM